MDTNSYLKTIVCELGVCHIIAKIYWYKFFDAKNLSYCDIYTVETQWCMMFTTAYMSESKSSTAASTSSSNEDLVPKRGTDR